jgi:hypothetical protein
VVIGEVLNHTIKRETQRGRINGINLLGATELQVIAQFVDDISKSLVAEEQVVHAMRVTDFATL